jgi:hypothetical protein
LFVAEEMDHEHTKKNATMMSKRGSKTKNTRITMNMNRKKGGGEKWRFCLLLRI